MPLRWPLLQRVLPRASARLRLTVAFALVVASAGAAIVTSIYLVMTFVPAYAITSSATSAVERGHGGTTIGSTVLQPDPNMSSDSAAASPHLVTVDGPGEILSLLLTTSVIVALAVLLLGTGVCWIVAGRVLRPIDSIAEAARLASEGNLDHRIGLTGPDDEFRRLADTFDDMLGRLELSFQAQRRFAANASHELRTPLATTQAILDVALLDPEGIEPETLTRKLRETNTRNIETVESLLALADAQSGQIARERIDLDDVAREVVASSRADAAERGIALHSTILAAPTVGDPILLRLLLTNVMGNALRYNRVDGDVWLTVSTDGIRIENTGPAVAADDVARLTEPFFRPAGRLAGSHGLGLALVAAIAESHGARLTITPRDAGGLLIEVAFHRVAA